MFNRSNIERSNDTISDASGDTVCDTGSQRSAAGARLLAEACNSIRPVNTSDSKPIDTVSLTQSLVRESEEHITFAPLDLKPQNQNSLNSTERFDDDYKRTLVLAFENLQKMEGPKIADIKNPDDREKAGALRDAILGGDLNSVKVIMNTYNGHAEDFRRIFAPVKAELEQKGVKLFYSNGSTMLVGDKDFRDQGELTIVSKNGGPGVSFSTDRRVTPRATGPFELTSHGLSDLLMVLDKDPKEVLNQILHVKNQALLKLPAHYSLPITTID